MEWISYTRLCDTGTQRELQYCCKLKEAERVPIWQKAGNNPAINDP